MKLIPNICRENNSNAEKKIFSLFSDIDLGPGWITFHSLNVSESTHKTMCEVDFALLGPQGLFVFEVKGGRIRCENGIWYYKDRYDVEHKSSEGPFIQAKNGMYALLDSLKKRNMNIDKLSFGYGILFPDIDTFNEQSTEWPIESVCDSRFTKNPDYFKKYLIRLIDYWVSKKKKAKLAHDDALLKEIRDYFRPNLDHSPSLLNKLREEDKEIIQHTEEQYEIIDSIEDNERIICTGGAGTGKSFLAVEIVRRELFKNKDVILLVMGDLFAAYLKNQLADELQNNQNRLAIYSLSELKNSLNDSNKQFDVLIVDEGQDLMSAENLDLFEAILKNGLAKGRWRYFMDPNKQAGVVGRFENDAYEILRSYNHASHKLLQNCRNTKQIVSQAEMHTGAKIGETLAKNNGKAVQHVDVTDQEDQLKQINNILDDLIGAQGFSCADIAILSPVNFSLSVASSLDKKWNKRIHEINENNVMLSDDKILFSTVSDFKGLERLCVILVDMEKIKEMKNSLSLLYIALTRARSYLLITSSKSFKEFLKFNLEQGHSNVS